MMITYLEACSIACEFYKKLNVNGLASARENDSCYIFSGGKRNTVNIGGVTICVQKTNGNVSPLKFPSKESTDLYNSSQSIPIPEEFFCE